MATRISSLGLSDEIHPETPQRNASRLASHVPFRAEGSCVIARLIKEDPEIGTGSRAISPSN